MFHKVCLKWVSIGILSFSCLVACTSKKMGGDDPKNRLKDYISKSFSIKTTMDRDELVNFLTGNAKQRLASWSDEQFRQAFIESKKKFLHLAFREIKNLSPTSMHITYELTYLDQSKGNGAGAKITNKKLCEMAFEKGLWVISEVHNIKELVEYTNELTLP